MKKFNEIYEEVGVVLYMCLLLVGMVLVPFFGTAAWVSVLLGITGICETFSTMGDNPIKGIVWTNVWFACAFGLAWFLCPTDILSLGLLITALLLPIRMMVWVYIWYTKRDED